MLNIERLRIYPASREQMEAYSQRKFIPDPLPAFLRRADGNMANTISLFRIAAGIVLLFCPVFSPAFYVFYIAAGLSDMLDGFVARKTDTVSKLGARLDTMADFVLVVVCLIKLLPVLRIPAWLYAWIGIIALIKNVNIISGFVGIPVGK